MEDSVVITGLELASWWGRRPCTAAAGSRDELRGLIALCRDVVAVLVDAQLLVPSSVTTDRDGDACGSLDELEARLLAEDGAVLDEIVVSGTTRIVEPSGVDRIVDGVITVTATQSNDQLVSIAVFDDAFMEHDLFGAPQRERHLLNAPRLQQALAAIAATISPLSPMSTKRAEAWGFELKNLVSVDGSVHPLDPNVLRRDGEDCPLFLTDQIVLGARLRAGSGDEVRAGYLARSPEIPLLITLTQRHEASIARLREELALDTPGIAPIAWLGNGPSDGIPYDDVLVELLPRGARLAARPLPESEARMLGAACADVLARAGRWIGGICPETLYVDADGGFATLAPRGPRFIASAPQHMRGLRSYPVPYEAPEVLALGRPPTVASDVFSLCATLVTLVTGKHPFGKELGEIMARVLAHAPDRLPGALGDVLARGLDADPARRPTAAQLAALLAR